MVTTHLAGDTQQVKNDCRHRYPEVQPQPPQHHFIIKYQHAIFTERMNQIILHGQN